MSLVATWRQCRPALARPRSPLAASLGPASRRALVMWCDVRRGRVARWWPFRPGRSAAPPSRPAPTLESDRFDRLLAAGARGGGIRIGADALASIARVLTWWTPRPRIR